MVDPRRKQRGFTLLEAIVALVLVSTSGMALFSWINNELTALDRIRQSNARDRAALNVLEYMNTVNPMLQPEGHAELGDYSVSWKSQPVLPPRDGASYPSGISLFRIGLYDTRLKVEMAGGKPWFDFTLRQVGYQKVRDMSLPF